MESLKKMLKLFLQPWSGIYKPQISSFTKAVVLGGSVSLMLLSVGWTLFSSSEDLRNRSVVSVLLSPDYRFIEDVPEQWIAIGTCSELTHRKLFTGRYFDGTYCRKWIETKRPSLWNPYSIDSSWSATKYRNVPREYARVLGSSRSDALGHAKDVWVNAGSSLLMPIVVLLVMQMGVLAGYQYFRRSSKADASDEEVS